MRNVLFASLVCVLCVALPARADAGAPPAPLPADNLQVRVGLTVDAAAAVVGTTWLGTVRRVPALAGPEPPAVARWLAAQAGVAYNPLWTPGGVVVAAAGGATASVPAPAGVAAVWPLGRPAPATGPVLHLSPTAGAFDGRPYAGTLSATVDGAGVTVVNRVPLEAYLRGVVPAEAYPGWPQAALQAQAVAARTFTLKNLGRRAALGFDLFADTRDQAYGGRAAETAATDAAVESTAGLVLTHAGHLIDAVYSANAGGMAASAAEVWGRAVPYLPAQPLPEEPADRWAVLLPAGPVLQAFPALGGTLVAAAAGAPSASGRVRDIVLTGARGRVHVALAALARAADPRGGIRSSLVTGVRVVFRVAAVGRDPAAAMDFAAWSGGGPVLWSALGAGPLLYARSTPAALYLTGLGYGHGVGLSQWGAQALAAQGWSFARILAHFYPGTRLTRLPA